MRLEPVFGSNLPPEATSKANVIRYENEEGPKSNNNPLPPEIFISELQCERETGRASETNVTPYGVGVFCVKNDNNNFLRLHDFDYLLESPPTPLGVTSACEALPVSLSHWSPKLKILEGGGNNSTHPPPYFHTL